MSGGCGDGERDRRQYPVCAGHERTDREPQGEGSLCDRAGRGLQGFLSRGEEAGVEPETAGRQPIPGPPGNVLGGSAPPGGLGISSGSRNGGERSRL